MSPEGGLTFIKGERQMQKIKADITVLCAAMAATVLSAGTLFAAEAAKAPDANKGEPVAVEAAGAAVKPEGAVSKEAAAAAARVADPDMREYRARAREMSRPRDKDIAALNEISAKADARRKAVLVENEAAAKLNAEIEELTKALEAKAAALTAILEADQELVDLNKALAAAHAELRKNQATVREEIARQHRERMAVIEKQRLEAEAAAKAKAAENAAKAESADGKTDKAEAK